MLPGCHSDEDSLRIQEQGLLPCNVRRRIHTHMELADELHQGNPLLDQRQLLADAAALAVAERKPGIWRAASRLLLGEAIGVELVWIGPKLPVPVEGPCGHRDVRARQDVVWSQRGGMVRRACLREHRGWSDKPEILFHDLQAIRQLAEMLPSDGLCGADHLHDLPIHFLLDLRVERQVVDQARNGSRGAVVPSDQERDDLTLDVRVGQELATLGVRLCQHPLSHVLDGAAADLTHDRALGSILCSCLGSGL
mmetsp:Transcript_15553/g.41234  ORF Transcript_15553/g.41234 Transcript_15553/m.41234 type:complete len:252 (-) Transcript_15553:409-1164(-)